jgi:transcriptional regulator GlxA family with amidase domain
MAKKKRTASPQAAPAAERSGVTPERFARLVQMVHLLADKPLTREVLTRRLKIDIRGFYRDLGLVRTVGVGVELVDSRYHLVNRLEEALGMLPFPDPLLTLSEARLLAKGRTAAHKKLREQLERIRP